MHASLTKHPGRLKAILGPTNTGKTHYALERMLAHRSGMIGLPLRLLAREVYLRLVGRVGGQSVALVTGEERIVPANARYWVATVEAMPLDIPVECMVVDEIQTAADFDRGHVFTDRILHARGISETLLLGAATMAPPIRKLLPQAEIVERPRLSTLLHTGSKKISRQPPRSAIVAFSAANVYAIAELIRRERGGAAVVMGALSPRTRNAQVELYENGEVDYLVATDAIGMGLNLDLTHVAFADDTKFDGRQTRPLTPPEFGQIAGRAGRHTKDGTFGVTGRAAPFDAEMVERLEAHEFEPLAKLQWRNRALDFSALDSLKASLDRTPDHAALIRAPTATDQLTFETLAAGEPGARATDAAGVTLLWECAQIPDFRDISPNQHAHLAANIFTQLTDKAKLDTDWIAEQVRFCDNGAGDIDTLSNRIRQIRTWTYVANKKNWLEDPTYWREKTRNIEDRLSDALHERLTQRFVDRRTSVLIRHLRDRSMTAPQINEMGEIYLEGHLIGTIEGFRFALARSEEGDPKGLRAAAANAVAPEIRNRAQRLAAAPNEELVLATDGFVRWRGEVVGELAKGDDVLAPRVLLLADESLTGPDLEAVQDRLALWLRHLVNTQLAPIIALREPAEIEGVARGLAFRLAEHLGIVPRPDVAGEVKQLDQDVRGKLRKLGVKFGAFHIYVPLALKPAPRELAILLWALQNGGIRQPGVTELPQIVLSGRTSIEADPEIAPELYAIAGFKLAGKRAVRVDILERLADLIRPLIAFDPARAEGEVPPGAAERNGFRVTVEMTSLLGCAGEDFSSILKSLGYRVDRRPLPEETNQTGANEDGQTSQDTALADTARLEGASNDDSDALADAAAASAETAQLQALDGQEPAPAPTPAPAPALEPSATDLTVTETPTTAETGLTKQHQDQPPEEPKFDEVWFPARHGERPRHKKRGPKPEARGNGPGGKNGKFHANGQNGDNPQKHSGGHKDRGKDRGKDRPRKERPVDPDSPFAALAALKNMQPK